MMNNRYKIKEFFMLNIWTPFRRIKNFFFCLRYPFWEARNVWTDKSCGYSFTLYDEIPDGWRRAFGKQLSKELKNALIKDKALKEFRFSQIKEKYGRLCLYNFGCGKNSGEVIRKYELMSIGYCINCGKPSKYCSKHWIEYYCEDCAKKNIKEEHLKECRLTKRDLPNIRSFKDGKEYNVNIKETYDIDFEELWGLNRNDKNTKK